MFHSSFKEQIAELDALCDDLELVYWKKKIRGMSVSAANRGASSIMLMIVL